MNLSESKKALAAAVFNEPHDFFGVSFTESKNGFKSNEKGGDYTERGKLRIKRSEGGGLLVFYNGSSRESVSSFLDYGAKHVFRSTFADTFRRACNMYGIDCNLSQAEAAAITAAEAAPTAAAALVEALRNDPAGSAAEYLKKRGFETDTDYFGSLTRKSIQAARNALQAAKISDIDEVLTALGITEERADKGYNVVIPYRHGGRITGFVFRTVVDTQPKYLFSKGLKRGGYCNELERGGGLFLVEGELDAIRLLTAGVSNVVALGGSTLSEEAAELLRRSDARRLVVVPDVEFDEQGRRKTKLTNRLISKLLDVKDYNGRQQVNELYISDLPTEAKPNAKTDADAYGREQGGAALVEAIEAAAPYWDWQLSRLEEEHHDRPTFAARFLDIYDAARPFDRSRITESVRKSEYYTAAGITAAALSDIDELRRQKERRAAMGTAAATITAAAAIDDAQKIEAEAARLLTICDKNQNFDNFMKHTDGDTFGDVLQMIAEQPREHRTRWTLYDVKKGGTCNAYPLTFTAADITFFCAPTSHGKTMILFQSALDMVQEGKTSLYVSFEENQRQLWQRALYNYILTESREPHLSRNVIKAVLTDDGEALKNYRPETVERLTAEINRLKGTFARDIFPRLKLVHLSASVEVMSSAIRQYISRERNAGRDVGGLFIDYVQLLHSDRSRRQRSDELKDICAELHKLAADVDLPVIVAAQLNRDSYRNSIDSVTLANIGEGADIERIAHDVFLIFQTDKVAEQVAQNPDGTRARRVTVGTIDRVKAVEGYLYIEHLKGRESRTGQWALLPYRGESGAIQSENADLMRQTRFSDTDVIL